MNIFSQPQSGVHVECRAALNIPTIATSQQVSTLLEQDGENSVHCRCELQIEDAEGKALLCSIVETSCT